MKQWTQTITGNKRFMKNVVLPMMRKAAITKVKAKEFPIRTNITTHIFCRKRKK